MKDFHKAFTANGKGEMNEKREREEGKYWSRKELKLFFRCLQKFNNTQENDPPLPK